MYIKKNKNEQQGKIKYIIVTLTGVRKLKLPRKLLVVFGIYMYLVIYYMV